MHGYLYLTTNMINGRKYLGLKKGCYDPAYIGSGSVLNRAIRRYGNENFSLEILGEFHNEHDLKTAFEAYTHQFRAKERNSQYSLAAGGGGSKSSDERSQIGIRVWENMSDQTKQIRSQKISSKVKGKPKSEAHRKAISEAKKGKPRNWSKETEEAYSKRRKTEVAEGICVPPSGNAGNKLFRHTEETKNIIRKKARMNRILITDERPSYISKQGKELRDEKIKNYYTPERRKLHGILIAEGKRKKKEE